MIKWQSLMLKQLFTLMKIGFKYRLLVSAIIVLSVPYFNMEMLPLMLRLGFGIAFIVAVGPWLMIYTPRFISTISLSVLSRQKIEWQPMPAEYGNLAERMGVTVERFGIKEGLDDAYCNAGKEVILGKKLIERLKSEHVLAIVAHEFGHIKGGHHIKKPLIIPLVLVIILSLPPMVFWPPMMLLFYSIALLIIVLIPISWKIELDADRIAAEYVGIENVKEALLAISKRNIHEPSETHPSIAERIKKLKRLK